MNGAKPETIEKYGHLNYTSSLSQSVVHFNPKDIAVHGLTAMIKTMAQMKNLRRSHTFQGTVKKVAIDQTYEGYANFMAPGRMQSIAYDAKNAKAALDQFNQAEAKNSEPAKSMSPDDRQAHKALLQQRIKDAGKVFTNDVLRPAADTYLSAEWDEFLPFPTSKSFSLFFMPYPVFADLSTQHGNSVLRATVPAITAPTSACCALRCCQTVSRLSTSRRVRAITAALSVMWRRNTLPSIAWKTNLQVVERWVRVCTRVWKGLEEFRMEK